MVRTFSLSAPDNCSTGSSAGRRAQRCCNVRHDLLARRCWSPLRAALMYNDGRAVAEAEEINALATKLTSRLGYRFNASFALPTLLWLQRVTLRMPVTCFKDG